MRDNVGNRRWWTAAALALSGVVIGVDATVLSLALPTLSTDLHASTAELQWFIDAYLLVLGAMMLPAGLLGDRFGRKRLLLAALALFGLGSADLLAMVERAFVQGMDVLLAWSGGIAAAAAVLALVFLPGQADRRAERPSPAHAAPEQAPTPV
jgi:MFS transporter, DHA2 family, multidrug resistance protein